MAKAKKGGKGKAPRADKNADKVPPTPSSAVAPQPESALPLPSPEKTPTAGTTPLPGSSMHTPPASPPAVPAKELNPEASVVSEAPTEPEVQAEDVVKEPSAQADAGETEPGHQLPTPAGTEEPLPTTENDANPTAQPEPAAEAATENIGEPHPGDTSVPGPDPEIPGAVDPFEPSQPMTTPEAEAETEPVVSADGEQQGTPKVEEYEAKQEGQTLSQPAEDLEKPLPPPPVDAEESASGGEEIATEQPEPSLLWTPDPVPGDGEGFTADVGGGGFGELQDVEPPLDFSEEPATQQPDLTLETFDAANAPAAEDQGGFGFTFGEGGAGEGEEEEGLPDLGDWVKEGNGHAADDTAVDAGGGDTVGGEAEGGMPDLSAGMGEEGGGEEEEGLPDLGDWVVTDAQPLDVGGEDDAIDPKTPGGWIPDFTGGAGEGVGFGDDEEELPDLPVDWTTPNPDPSLEISDNHDPEHQVDELQDDDEGLPDLPGDWVVKGASQEATTQQQQEEPDEGAEIVVVVPPEEEAGGEVLADAEGEYDEDAWGFTVEPATPMKEEHEDGEVEDLTQAPNGGPSPPQDNDAQASEDTAAVPGEVSLPSDEEQAPVDHLVDVDHEATNHPPDVVGEPEQQSELTMEQSVEAVDELTAFDNPKDAAEVVLEDPIKHVAVEEHILGSDEHHESDITEEHGDPIAQTPADTGVVDSGGSHELDITEMEAEPLDEVPAVEPSETPELSVASDISEPVEQAASGEIEAFGTSQSQAPEVPEDGGDPSERTPTTEHVAQDSQADLPEHADNPFEQAPTQELVDDPTLDLGLEFNVLEPQHEESPHEQGQTDQLADSQPTETVGGNVGLEVLEADEAPGEAGSGSAQEPPEADATLPDGDEPTAESIPTEGTLHPDETSAPDSSETTEYMSVAEGDVVDADDALVDGTVPAVPEPEADEGEPAITEQEGAHSGEATEQLGPTNTEEADPATATAPHPPPVEQADPQVEAESEKANDSTPSEIAEATEPPDEPHDPAAVPPLSHPGPESEPTPTSHSPTPEVGLDLQEPPISIDQATQQEEQQDVMPPKTNEMTVTARDDHAETHDAAGPSDPTPTALLNGVALAGQEPLRSPALFAQDIATPEILAISEMFGTMKAALLAMSSAFDRLTDQTERMAANSLQIKATEQLGGVKAALGRQVERQKQEVEALRVVLQGKIKQAAEEKIRASLREAIKQSVKAQVEEKVRAHMALQIPDELRQQVISHQRKIIQVKTDLHNSEARMYNALQITPGARLRPLLRPLPTPEQSPVIINMSRSTSMGNTTLNTPWTALPSGPAPTPIRRSVSNSGRPGGGGLETVPPTPSKFFPRDLKALFALSPDEARRLLREYGLKSTAPSPAVENNTPMRARGLSIVNEEGVEEDPEVHARDMNTFLAHIGVPFLMIPPPKEKPGDDDPPLSSRSRRKMLTPLIIK